MFCIKFGYYNTKDWKAARYGDMIVDTFADVLGASSKILFGPPEKKDENTAAFIAIAKKFHCMVECNLNHHGGKWAAGNNVGIADFIMASWVGNFVMNQENPCSPTLQGCLDETPKFKVYASNIMTEFTWLKRRGNVGAF